MKKLTLVLFLTAMTLAVVAANVGACGSWRFWPCE